MARDEESAKVLKIFHVLETLCVRTRRTERYASCSSSCPLAILAGTLAQTLYA